MRERRVECKRRLETNRLKGMHKPLGNSLPACNHFGTTYLRLVLCDGSGESDTVNNSKYKYYLL